MTSLIIFPNLRTNHVTNMSVIVGKSGFANQTTFEALMDKANHPKTNWDLSSYKNQPDIFQTLAVGKNFAWNDREVMCLHIYKCAKIQGAIPSL